MLMRFNCPQSFPPELVHEKDNPRIAADMHQQKQLFDSRRAAIKNELAILEEQLGGMRDLAKEGYLARNRLLDVERTYVQRKQGYESEVRTQLADVQKEAEALKMRLTSLDFDLENAIVKAPVDGTVVGMVGSAKLGQPCVAMVVTDNGVGMDMAQISTIFDPFFTTKELGKGTGLGLSVVHSIVLEHHGAVVIRSRFGRGTEIRIILPGFAVSEYEKSEAPVLPQKVMPGRVLVVDDDVNFGKMLSQLMTRNGWDVVYRNDPLEALETVEGNPHHWDLVITDQVMPNLRGQDLIAKIKTLNPRLPCILCT